MREQHKHDYERSLAQREYTTASLEGMMCRWIWMCAIGYLKFAMAPKCRDASIHTGIDSKE